MKIKYIGYALAMFGIFILAVLVYGGLGLFMAWIFLEASRCFWTAPILMALAIVALAINTNRRLIKKWSTKKKN